MSNSRTCYWCLRWAYYISPEPELINQIFINPSEIHGEHPTLSVPPHTQMLFFVSGQISSWHLPLLPFNLPKLNNVTEPLLQQYLMFPQCPAAWLVTKRPRVGLNDAFMCFAIASLCWRREQIKDSSSCPSIHSHPCPVPSQRTRSLL